MTTPQDNSKDLPNEINDAVLAQQLRALPQAEPSAALDAAILGKIEQALKIEAEQKDLAKANQVTAINAHQKPRQHFFQGLEHKLKQFWFIPAGAMALLLASVTLNQPQPLSEKTTSEILAKEVAAKTNSPTQNPTRSDQSTTIAMTETETPAASTSPPTSSTVRSSDTAAKTVVDSKKMATELALLIEKKSKERIANKEQAKTTSTGELAQLGERERAFEKSVTKPDQIIAKSLSAPPAPTPAPAPIVADAKSSVSHPTVNADMQRIEVTGSSIKRLSVKSSGAVQSLSKNDKTEEKSAEKTELYAVKDVYEPNLKIAQEEKKLAKVSPLEPAAIMEVPKPTEAMEKAPAAAPIARAFESSRAAPSAVDLMRVRLEQLIDLGRTADALQLWKDFQENYPKAVLTPELQKKLEDLERKQNTKKK
jgi:hypothetical protein